MRSRSQRSGFSLLEVMVSLGVAMLVLLLALGAMNSASDGYAESTNRVAATREARAVLGLMAEDFAKALPDEVPVIEASTRDWPRDRAGFLCLQPDDAQAVSRRVGDVCGVVYYVRDWDLGDRVVPSLWRGFRSSGKVFEALKNGRVDELYRASPNDEPIAKGVVSIAIQPLVRGDDGAFQAWEDGGAGQAVPEVMMVRLVMARRELMGKLRTVEDWEASNLLGRYEESGESRFVEVFEFTQPFGHAG